MLIICIWYFCSLEPIECKGKRYEGTKAELDAASILADKNDYSLMFACGNKEKLFKLYPEELPLSDIKVGSKVK